MVSPAIPLVANAALAVLWWFSAFGGWGDLAFCGESGPRDPECLQGMDTAATVSLVPAGLALAVAAVSLAVPRVRRDIGRLDLMLTVSAFIWIVAEAILFFSGYRLQA